LAPEEKTLTQDIKTRSLTGDTLAKAHMARGPIRLPRKEIGSKKQGRRRILTIRRAEKCGCREVDRTDLQEAARRSCSRG
jgi:hypothetical protein